MYQHTGDLVKDVNDVLFADSHSILNMWKYYFTN